MNIKIRLDVEQCDLEVKGQFASGDEAVDRDLESEIKERLARGELWAWCDVILTATAEVDGHVFKGRDSIGACSYKDEADFKENSGYYGDMKDRAIAEIKEDISAASRRALAAVRAMLDFNEGKVQIEEEV